MPEKVQDTADSVCWKRVADYYREQIISGALPMGSCLPTTKEIARTFDTSVYTVQYALSALSHENLVNRRPRFGTVVNSYKPKLKVVAIILFAATPGAYQEMLAMELSKELRAKNCLPITMIEDSNNPELVKNIKNAIQKMGIQGIIPFAASEKVSKMLQKLNIVTVSDSSYYASRCVIVPREKFTSLGVEELHKQGCKRPALIASFSEEKNNSRDAVEQSRIKFFKNYCETIEKYDMEYKEELVIKQSQHRPLTNAEYAEYAYHSFHQLWQQKQKPDSLIVYTDNLIPGVTQAILELGVKVPEDLKLVMHHNIGIDFFTPFDYTKLAVDTKDVAEAMVAMLFRQFHREEVSPTVIQYKFDEED